MFATVTLQLLDLFTEETVERTICASNVHVAGGSNGWECQVLASEEKQRELLNDWIADRGNEQHDTLLKLVSWKVNVNA